LDYSLAASLAKWALKLIKQQHADFLSQFCICFGWVARFVDATGRKLSWVPS
jgi:hypothetical protein